MLLHVAGVLSVLLVTLSLFNAGTPLSHPLADGADLLIKVLLVLSFWWLNIRLFRHKHLLAQFILHFITLLTFSACWWLTVKFFFSNELPQQGQYSGAFNFLLLLLWMYCFALAIYHAWHFRAHSKVHQARERRWKARANQGDVQILKAQIQPHFLFNTLNRINASIPPQQEHTRELIAKLADTFRYALQATKEDEVPLADELHFIKTYLELEKERFGERLQVSIEAGSELMQVKIAPMLLQPLIENAVIHGIGPAVQGGSISLRCRTLQGKVQICISNTGAHYMGPVDWLLQGKGVGLRNTVLRLEKIYQEQMHIEKNTTGGLTFTFSIPAAS